MRFRLMMILLALLALLIVPHLLMASRIQGYKHWSQASWASAGIIDANPAGLDDAVVQVYAARAWGWKGVFAVHPFRGVGVAQVAASTITRKATAIIPAANILRHVTTESADISDLWACYYASRIS